MAKFNQASDIQVGVIGYGGAFNMGKAHLEQMREAGMTPRAVAEIDVKRLEVATKDFPGIETYASVAEMLKKSDVNMLAIITPHNTHAPLAIQCLKAGRHVVCEKPFAVTTAECDRMIAEAKKRKLVVSTYHNRHWDGCIMQAVKRIKDERAIGDIIRIEAHMGGYSQPQDWWRTSKTISGGILYDWGVHLLEYSLQLIDAPLSEVSGFASRGFWAPKTKWKDDTIEDEGFLVARFVGGQWVTLTITTIDSNPKKGQLEITGKEGTYVFDGRTWELSRISAGVTTVTKGNNPPSEYVKYYKNVADHLTGNAELIITPQWARRPIHMLDLACKSAEAGKAMKPKYQ